MHLFGASNHCLLYLYADFFPWVCETACYDFTESGSLKTLTPNQLPEGSRDKLPRRGLDQLSHLEGPLSNQLSCLQAVQCASGF